MKEKSPIEKAISSLFTFVLIVILFLTKPTRSDFLETVISEHKSTETTSVDRAGEALGALLFSELFLEYHDYLLFAVVETKIGPERRWIGIVGTWIALP
jgi:hypothetical protein